MISSQPEIVTRSTGSVDDSASQDSYFSTEKSLNPGFMTQKERDAKIARFEGDLPGLKEKLEHLKAKIKEEITEPNSLKLYYFIGRLNPPHLGHIETLCQLIQTAQSRNPLYKVIILLGSGPGKKQTLNDPLSFNFKKKVVIDLLRDKGGLNIDNLIASGNVKIEEMDKAASQIVGEIQTIINLYKTINYIETFRFSGDKDGDINKLDWIENSIQKLLYPQEVITNVVDIETELEDEATPTAMSATAVRNDALEAYLLEHNKERGRDERTGYNMFKQHYDAIYGNNTEAIYDAIIDQAKNFSSDEIQDYIVNKILPKTKKPQKPQKAGSRKGRKLTKRRKTRRKLTKKRSKRRKTRRH